MLMKLTPGVNFINILRAHFLYECELHRFSLITIWLCDFWLKDIGEKCACKMLMKLTPGIVISIYLNSLVITLPVRTCFNVILSKLVRYSTHFFQSEVDVLHCANTGTKLLNKISS